MKLKVGQYITFFGNTEFYLLFNYKTSSFVNYYQSILLNTDDGIPKYDENAKETFDKVREL